MPSSLPFIAMLLALVVAPLSLRAVNHLVDGSGVNRSYLAEVAAVGGLFTLLLVLRSRISFDFMT